MLTRPLLWSGLILILLWFVGRAWLTLSTPSPTEARFTVPGEALVRGLEVADASLGTAATLPPPATPAPTRLSTPVAVAVRTLTPMPRVATTPGCFTYTVGPSDTLATLAQRFDTTVSSILQHNDLSGVARPRAGQRLAVCPGPAAQPAAALPRYWVYRTQPGDTLPGLALRFGVPVYTLAQTNNLPLSARLYPGQSLRLPDSALLRAEVVEVASLPQAVPPAPARPPGPAPRRVPVPQATETVHIAWPRRTTTDQTATVRLGFGRTAPLPSAGGLSLVAVLPTAVPQTVFRVDRAVAAAYDGVLVARLEAPGVEPSFVTADAQALTQADMGWTWSLAPRQPGRYQARASLEVRWTPRDGGAPIVCTVWQQPLDIEVVQAPLPSGLLNLLGLVGLVLVVLDLVRHRPQPRTRPF